ncbi:MAG: TadE family protein [Candidatus Spyradenecus sp.]
MKRSCREVRYRGSVMMETVLIMPWFLLLVFGIIQTAILWTARLMCDYAAFCAARAALVYAPADYAEACPKAQNVAYLAARQVLGWMSFSPAGTSSASVPGWGEVPCSGLLDRQLKVSVAEEPESNSVCATVNFAFPLFVPVFATLIPAVIDQDAGIERALVISSACTLPKPWSTVAWPSRQNCQEETP